MTRTTRMNLLTLLAATAAASCIDDARPPGGAGTPTAAAAATEQIVGALQADTHFTFQIPAGASATDFAIVTSNFADLADRVSLVTPTGGYAKLSSSGSYMTTLGVESHTGSLVSKGKVFLRERAHVHGDLVTGARQVDDRALFRGAA